MENNVINQNNEPIDTNFILASNHTAAADAVIIAASMKKIPVIAHESDLTPGLANKLAAPFCNKLCVTFRESLNYVKDGKGALTGTPIREEILKGLKEIREKRQTTSKEEILKGLNDIRERRQITLTEERTSLSMTMS